MPTSKKPIEVVIDESGRPVVKGGDGALAQRLAADVNVQCNPSGCTVNNYCKPGLTAPKTPAGG